MTLIHKLISVFLIFILLSVIPLSSQAESLSDVAALDYADYSSTKFASTKWDSYVKEGFGAFQAGDIDMAQKNLYKAFNLGCESPLVLFQLALINESQKSYYSALDFYKMAKEKFKSANRDHRYLKTFNENYGRALYNSGKTDEAWPVLQAAAKKSQSFWLLKMVGLIAAAEGDAPNATSYLERAIRTNSTEITTADLVLIYTTLARLFLNQGERDGAARNYNKVLEFDPNNVEAKQYIAAIRKSYDQDRMMKVMDNLTHF